MSDTHQDKVRRQKWRFVCFALDEAPLWIAVAGAASPLLFVLAVHTYDSIFGVGIFDPALGGDPVHLQFMRWHARTAFGWLLALTTWTAVQSILGATSASLGNLLAGVRVFDTNGHLAPRPRRIAREVIRAAPSIAVVGFVIAFPHAIAPVASFCVLVSALLVMAWISVWSLLRSIRGDETLVDRVLRTRAAKRCTPANGSTRMSAS